MKYLVLLLLVLDVSMMAGCSFKFKSEPERQTWGKAVDGIQVSLQATQKIWKQGENPSFKLRIRNQGTRQLLISVK